MITQMMECFDPHLLLEILKSDQKLATKVRKFTNLDSKSQLTHKSKSVDKEVLKKIQNSIASKEEELKLRDLALYEYSIGAYHEAAENLFFLTVSKFNDIRKEALWGKLACEILLKNFKAAEKALDDLVKEVDEKDHQVALRERIFLCHWVLFLDVSVQLELFLKLAYMNAIQMVSPWLLRYVVVAVLISKKSIKELAKILSCDSQKVDDPIVQFFEAIYCGSLDINMASIKLKEIQNIIKKDYFLEKVAEKFINSCQTIIFQVLVKTHTKIGLDKLGSMMQKSKQDTITWIKDYQKVHSNVILDDSSVSVARKKCLNLTDVIDYLNQFGNSTQGSVEIDDSFVGPKYSIV